jgi:hypothetical protein
LPPVPGSSTMAVDPHVVYKLSRAFAENVQAFIYAHGEEWDGGSIGYEAAEIHAQAEELLNAMASTRPEEQE